jgi:hypothetical protein
MPEEIISPQAMTEISQNVKDKMPDGCAYCILFFSTSKAAPVAYISDQPQEIVMRLFNAIGSKQKSKGHRR